MESILKATAEIKIRFSEVDMLTIVWHGHYLKYLEEAREAFGLKYGLGYLDIYNEGFLAPLVNIAIEYKKSLMYGDNAVVEVTYVDSPAAKLIFEYKVYNSASKELVATGSSTQVFISKNTAELCLTVPEFISDWKKKMGLEE